MNDNGAPEVKNRICSECERKSFWSSFFQKACKGLGTKFPRFSTLGSVFLKGFGETFHKWKKFPQEFLTFVKFIISHFFDKLMFSWKSSRMTMEHQRSKIRFVLYAKDKVFCPTFFHLLSWKKVSKELLCETSFRCRMLDLSGCCRWTTTGHQKLKMRIYTMCKR